MGYAPPDKEMVSPIAAMVPVRGIALPRPQLHQRVAVAVVVAVAVAGAAVVAAAHALAERASVNKYRLIQTARRI
jgi:hypothetical protein